MPMTADSISLFSLSCVAILDFNGNMTHSYRPHMHPIRQVKVDSSGEYIGTSSEDGNVIIYGLYTKETVSYSYGRPVSATRDGLFPMGLLPIPSFLTACLFAGVGACFRSRFCKEGHTPVCVRWPRRKIDFKLKRISWLRIQRFPFSSSSPTPLPSQHFILSQRRFFTQAKGLSTLSRGGAL
jgi:hypothetical protein